jgi:hypothetical protein
MKSTALLTAHAAFPSGGKVWRLTYVPVFAGSRFLKKSTFAFGNAKTACGRRLSARVGVPRLQSYSLGTPAKTAAGPSGAQQVRERSTAELSSGHRGMLVARSPVRRAFWKLRGPTD